jgi:hypothetical protein
MSKGLKMRVALLVPYFALVFYLFSRSRAASGEALSDPVCQAILDPRPRCDLCHEFRRRVQSLGVKAVISALRSPWQDAFAERMIGSIRRECLDHVVVLSQRHLRRLLKSYFTYYHRSRTHLALAKDAPESRAIMSRGEIVAIPQVGDSHRRYARHVA